MSAPLSLWQIGNGIGVGHLIYTPLACGMAVRAGQTSLNHGDASMRRATRKQQARIYTIGVLTLTGPNPEPLLKALREGLADAGYVEGRNLRLEIRSAQGRPDLQLEKAAPRHPERTSAAITTCDGTPIIMVGIE